MIGEDKAALGTAELDLGELMMEPARTSKQAKLINGVWRKELSLSRPSVTDEAETLEDEGRIVSSGNKAGNGARKKLADVALGLRVEVDLQFAR